MSANRNITRLDRGKSSGYLVRFMRRGKRQSGFFKDAEYGGKRKAMLAAREYRDELEEKLAKKGYTAKQLAQSLKSNNTSGIAGVRLVEETDKRWKSKPSYQFWVAQWSPEKGVRKSARFSVAKYGYEEAKALAIKARKKGVNSMGKR